MERLFSLDVPWTRFLRNTLIATVAALVPLLALYVALTPGFGTSLAGGGPALSRFLRQVLTNGVPVVFIVNYIGFFLYALIDARGDLGRRPEVFVLIDLPARLVVFVVLHVVIYVLSADWFGSFGGSRLTALGVVAPTLARSALFENISGVYLYATAISALPLYVHAFERSPLLAGQRAHGRGRLVAVSLAVLLFAVFVLTLTLIASVVTEVLSA